MKKVAAFIFASIMTVIFAGCNAAPVDNTRPNENGTQINIAVDDEVFAATLADNQTAEAFADMLPLTLNMSEMNGNEKYNYLDDNLPTDSYRPGTIQVGDLMLYGSNCVVLFYETFSSSYSYTRIGWVNDTNGLTAALGSGNVTVVFVLAGGNVQEEPEQQGDSETPTEPEIPTEPETPGEPGDIENGEEITVMYIFINGNSLEITLAENSSVTALVDILKQGDLTYSANDYGGFEKVGNLGHTLPTNHTQTRTEPGDVILYQTNQIVLFYGSNSWSYTRLGKINGYSAEELRELLGAGMGSLQVRLSL